MAGTREQAHTPNLIQDQREITSTAIQVIQAVRKNRGRPLQPRDRMALKLLTPRNSALIVKDGCRHLACRQVSFDIVTDDLGKGVHRLTPSGVHVLNPEKGWWSDEYGQGRFLWNLYLKEGPATGIARVLERLFKFQMKGWFGPHARIQAKDQARTITGEVDQNLRLFIRREEGSVETTLRRMVKAKAIHSPRDLGLKLNHAGRGHVVLLFGQDQRFAVSFTIERI
jgi:hypothetical protein